jgi:RNA polymerase sigma-70 factor (ECF subfamily)
MAYRMLRDKEEAEDVVQEVFVLIWHQQVNFREQAQLSTWIYRIATNKCIDHLRAKKRRAILRWLKPSTDKHFSAISEQFDVGSDPLEALYRKEQRLALHTALATLPVMQQSAFVLLKMEGLSQKEAAIVLNLSEKALESLLQRANKGLRKKLDKFYDERRKSK